MTIYNNIETVGFSCPVCNRSLKQITITHIKAHHSEFSSLDDFIKFYNIESKSDPNLGVHLSVSRKGKKRGKYDWSSGKHQEYIKQRDFTGENHWNYGNTTSDDVKNSISNGVVESEKFKSYIEETKTYEWKTKHSELVKHGHLEKKKRNPENYFDETELSSWKLYCQLVTKITSRNIYLFKHILDPDNLRNRSHGSSRYEIDHMFSKYYGFKNNIPPYIIGDISNLVLIPYLNNRVKSKKCSVSVSELFQRFNSVNHCFLDTKECNQFTYELSDKEVTMIIPLLNEIIEFKK